VRLIARVVVAVLLLSVAGWMRYNRTHSGGGSGASSGGISGTSAGGVPMVKASDGDPRIVAATTEAKRRWPEFVTAFEHPGGRKGFAVKHAFPTKDGSKEHMWVNLTAIHGNQIMGTLDDQPLADIGYKENDPVTLTVADVEDWVYVDSGKMVGGFSVAALETIEGEQKNK
jgi:uncharacterized protein YegJ (DUF2314 family)